MPMPGDTPAVLIDTHVHIHGCFPLAGFFDAAHVNFERAARAQPETHKSSDGGFIGVLMLTETARADCFKRLSAWADGAADGVDSVLGDWRLRHTEETGSVTAECHGQCLYIIAGRQIVTAERLEVLALGFEGFVPDGEPIRQVIDRVRSAAAVAVIPWGFGKWWGGRGKVVSALLKDHEALGFFLGDNSGRTALLGRPAHFEDARRDGIAILPGTDPLPFPAEYGRAGSFGLVAHATIDPGRPAAEIKRLLTGTPLGLKPYGRLETPLRFLHNQIAMQFHKHAAS
ncbi:MAG: hypothetical protein ACT4QB_01005 [Gammaproteobacteria bacterium]